MKIAAVYDIHGNLPALEAVLREIAVEQPDLVLVGGDVAAGPMPRATIECLMNLGNRARFVRGNADRMLVQSFDRLSSPDSALDVSQEGEWIARQIEATHRDFLAEFRESVVLPIDDLGDVLFCHGSPHSDEDIITEATVESRVQLLLEGVLQPTVVCGHTHMQYDRLVGSTRLVNAGSVGMPYGNPGAYWALLGPEVILRRTDYDLQQAAEQIRESGYPQAIDFADHNVLQPPTASDAVALFESMIRSGGST